MMKRRRFQAHLPGRAQGAAGADAADRESGAEGSPLPAGLRGFYEGRFGHDFGAVRVHTGQRSAEAAAQVSAQAFTRGQDIYFSAVTTSRIPARANGFSPTNWPTRSARRG